MADPAVAGVWAVVLAPDRDQGVGQPCPLRSGIDCRGVYFRFLNAVAARVQHPFQFTTNQLLNRLAPVMG